MVKNAYGNLQFAYWCPNPPTLVSLINVEGGMNVEGVQKLQNQKTGRLGYCS